MKLFYSSHSPFVRKVRVTAIMLGLEKRIEIIDTPTTPIATDPAVAAANPLGKIPALVTDDGDSLFDSRVICEYLISLAGNQTLLPAAGPARWTALRQQALADGLMEAAILRRYESFLRPEDKRWADWDAAQKGKIEGALDAFEAGAGDLQGPTLGTIAAGCAVGYLDLRFAAEDWRQGRPKLAEWYEATARHKAMKATHISQ
jgi:glutathione S-transferase